MFKMVQAHGLKAGPTQRPLLAGAASGAIACVPASAVLVALGSFQAATGALGLRMAGIVLASCALNVLSGAAYGWLFQRAANDTRGGWLFGLAFGFVVWMLVPIPILQWLPNRPTLTGHPAAGLLLGQLLWGLCLGLVFPFIYRRLHVKLDRRPLAFRTGPEAVVQNVPR